MTISNSLLDYEVPLSFQYPITKSTLSRKIYQVGKKILIFLQKNQCTLAISLSSFLITKTIASQIEDISLVPTVKTSLKDCQDRICAYWNHTMQRQENNFLEGVNNSLSKIDFRCDISHPEYKPFKSAKKCLKHWCKYTTASVKNSTECFDPTKKIISLWNKFCPKSQFDRLKNSHKIKYLGNCLKNLCNHYKTHNQTSNFYSFCVPVEMHHSMEKLYKLVKNWKNAELETKLESESAESILSMSSSSLGIISAGVSIIASVIGCYVAKKTMSSVSTTLPKVSMGLKNIVDGTLAYARRASTLPLDLLSVPSIKTRVSQISSQVDSVYYDAASATSVEEVSDIREFNYNFGFDAEAEGVLSPNIASELVEEKKLPYEEILPEGANFADDLAGKVIQAVKVVTQKAISSFSSSNETTSYEELFDTSRKPANEFIQFKQKSIEFAFPNMTNFLRNATAKGIEVMQIVTQKILSEEIITPTPEKTFDYSQNVTSLVVSSTNATTLSPLQRYRILAKALNHG